MSIALQLGTGTSYIPWAPSAQNPNEVHAQSVLAQYGLGQPEGLEVDAWFAQITRASRVVDGLRFVTDGDDYTKLRRWEIGDEVPDRVSAAVALIAYYLPRSGGEVPDPARQPTEISAGEVTIKYADGYPVLQPAQADDDVLAARLGLPSVDAFRLLRPYLTLPDSLEQTSSDDDVDGGGVVAFTQGAAATSLSEISA